MADEDIITRINDLAHEEHQLFEKESEGRASTKERERLKEIEVQLDQCWDLLHQRRARRSAGMDPDQAAVRPETTVEGYVG
jgi:uncharacterized protein DUF2630